MQSSPSVDYSRELEPQSSEDRSLDVENEDDTRSKYQNSIDSRERKSSVIIHEANEFGSYNTLRRGSKAAIAFTREEEELLERASPRKNASHDGNKDMLNSIDESSDTSSVYESDSDNEDLPIEKQLERERAKGIRANRTISALLQQITQYKTAIEGEKAALEDQMKEERARWKKEEKTLKGQSHKFEKQVENLNAVLNQTASEYEGKLQELEEEKTTRSKETIENLQTLIRELNYIEEVNEDLTKQMEKENAIKNNLQEELKTSKQLIDQLSAKVGALQEENASINSKSEQGLKEFLVIDNVPEIDSPMSPGKDGEVDKSKVQLTAELNRMKQLYAQMAQDLEKEKTKIQSVDYLVNQIRTITAPANSDINQTEAEEKRIILKKLLEEKEAHSNTLQTLNDERKKSHNDREYMDSLSQRIKDLIQSHSNTLKQLEEERDAVRQGKDIVKELQGEIKNLKSEKRGKLLVLSSVEKDNIEVYSSPVYSDEEEKPKRSLKRSSKKHTSDSESSIDKSPVIPPAKGKVYIPELRLDAPDPKVLRPGLKSKFPPVGNKPAFYSLRHKKSYSTGVFPEFSDDSAIDFDTSDLPQSVSGAKIRETLRRYMKQNQEIQETRTPPDSRTPVVLSPRDSRDTAATPRQKVLEEIKSRPKIKDGSVTERNERHRVTRKRSGSKTSHSAQMYDPRIKSTSALLSVPKLTIPSGDGDKSPRQVQSAREPSSDERIELRSSSSSKLKTRNESDPALTYTPKKDNPFLDLLTEKEKKKSKKEKKVKKESRDKEKDKDKERRLERKGSLGSASLDSMPVRATVDKKSMVQTMDKKLWAQMLSSGFYN